MEDAGTIFDQVNKAYGLLGEWKNEMQIHADAIADLEENAVQDILDEWRSARSNEVRRGLVQDQLDDNEEYKNHRRAYRTARNNFRLAQLEVERVKVLVSAIDAVSLYPDLGIGLRVHERSS